MPLEIVEQHVISEHRVSLPDIDIDTESRRRERILQALRKNFGGESRVVNVATFGTEKSKSAIQTAARGLGISDDEATYLSSMVPSERGFLWSLKDCYYGNVEEGRAPIQQFVNEMNTSYPELWKVAQHIEGLISRRGIHAAGILISNEDFYEHNAIMKAPNGALTSQFELSDTEYLGGVKLDLLSIEALDKIRVALDLLVEYNYVDRYRKLKDTYMSVLDPANKKILNYDNPAIWDLVAKGEVLSLFQLDTPVGMTAAKQVKPRNIAELSSINSLMRLMASEGEMPLDTFMRHRENPSIWENEMEQAGLSKAERDILHEHLDSRYGVAESQESMMILAMDERIAGFTVAEADALRKAVAKKSYEDFEKMEKLFYEKGRARNTSEALLSYTWETQVKRQRGYSLNEGDVA
jgi:DNA polymerase-3 subunit alpha